MNYHSTIRIQSLTQTCFFYGDRRNFNQMKIFVGTIHSPTLPQTWQITASQILFVPADCRMLLAELWRENLETKMVQKSQLWCKWIFKVAYDIPTKKYGVTELRVEIFQIVVRFLLVFINTLQSPNYMYIHT